MAASLKRSASRRAIATAPAVRGKSQQPRAVLAFDAAKNARRLRAVPSNTTELNTLTRSYGKSVVARSRYLAVNNSYVVAAKRTFVAGLVGDGIKPSSLIEAANVKKEVQELFLEWTDEADADGITDFYGIQSIIAGEMFDAGECFVRLRPRRMEDGLSVPLQLQILPSEMLPLDKNEKRSNGNYIESGIEFNGIGKRVAYHFWRRHPGSDKQFLTPSASQTVAVPADQVLHLFKPIQAGQIRGLPHTLAGIVQMAILDLYEDAELERKRIAALFGAFVTKPADEDEPPLMDRTSVDGANPPGVQPSDSFALEPGATVELRPGEDIAFAEPADVGGSYEAFMLRNLLKVSAGYGVPYMSMTGDLRQANYGSIRAGLVDFRRAVSQLQNHVMIFQFCRPIWKRWMSDAVLTDAVPISPTEFAAKPRPFLKVKWITPKWEWVDPFKDRQAEKLAVRAGFKSRSDVIEAEGYDPEEVDQRIAADRDRADSLGLIFDSDAENTSGAGVTQARPAGSEFPQEDDPNDPGQPPAPPPEDNPPQPRQRKPRQRRQPPAPKKGAQP